MRAWGGGPRAALVFFSIHGESVHRMRVKKKKMENEGMLSAEASSDKRKGSGLPTHT